MPHKFDGINVDDVVRVVKGALLLNGVPVTEIELANLKQEARVLKNFRIWSIMQETVKAHAIDKGFNDATEWEHTLAGKMMVHNLGLLKSMVDVFDNYTIPQVPPPRKRGGIPLP